MADKTLLEQRNDLMVEIRNLAKSREDAGGDFTADETATITDRMAKARDLTEQISAQKTQALLADDVKSFLAEADAEDVNADALKGSRKGIPGARRVKSLGEYFTTSDQWKKAMSPYGDREVSSKTAFGSDPVEVPGGLKAMISGQKAVIGTDPLGDGSGAGATWDPMRIPTVDATWPQLKLRNVVTVGTTQSDAVVYARVLRAGSGGSTNSAAGVAEAKSELPIDPTTGSGHPVTGTTTAALGGLKPESGMLFQKVTAPVITIAHWVAATKKALSDAGQLRTLIDNFLSAGLAQKLEAEMISGDSSTGEDFDGIENVDGILTQSFNTNILVTIRKAITAVRKYGTPNAVLMSPANAERIDLLRTSTGAYLGSGAFGPAIPAVWRTPIVEVPALDDAHVLVGDFSTAVLWDREEAVISVTDSHLDFFTRNLVAILAEARAAFGVLDPALICSAAVTGSDVIVPS